MKVLLSILFVITIIGANVALYLLLMRHGAGENHYPDIKDLWETSGIGWYYDGFDSYSGHHNLGRILLFDCFFLL